MGTESSKPDLFSPASNRASSSASANLSSTSIATTNAAVSPSASRHILPVNLPHAMKQLTDTELDRLLSAVISEQNQRGKKLAVSPESTRKRQIEPLAVPLTQGKLKRQIEPLAVPLTQGKLNAVRAAFKAGVTPSRIARQFGISQSDVRKALTGISTQR
jgi:hypothetical protein